MDKFLNLIEDEHLPDMGKYWRPLIPVKQDTRMTPDTFKEAVLNSEPVLELCRRYGGGDPTDEQEVRQNIKDILNEIAFKRNMTVIRFLGITLNKIVRQMTTGVYVNRPAIFDVKRELSLGKSTVLYLPSHRSYADFVLMSYVCFAYDLEIPAIAAGMDFQAMFAMGTMLRNTGAFFMRRSFSSDRLYWDVFREYVRAIVAKYHSGLEFFIEGTRSRSYKALTPKIGLFSMALESFLTREVFDIKIVPVGFSYDRPLEEGLFAWEMLGVPKPKETTKGLLKAFETVESNHGRMYVNFGETMSLIDYFGTDQSIFCHPNEKNVPVLTPDKVHKIRNLSHRVVDEQQRLIVLTTFNLISVYFSYRSQINESVDLRQLNNGVKRLGRFLHSFGALLSYEKASNIEQDIDDALSIHSNIMVFGDNKQLQLVAGKIVANQNCDLNKLKGHNLSARTMRFCMPAILLQIYANPCLYWFHEPAFYVLSHRIQRHSIIFDEMKEMKKIFATEFVVNQNDEDARLYQTIKAYASLDILADLELSQLLLSAILPFVFCYLNVAEVLLSQFTGKTFSDKELYVNCQKHIEIGLNQNTAFIHPYCLALDSISNCLYSFVVNKSGVRKTAPTKSQPTALYTVVDTELTDVLQQLRRYATALREFNGLCHYVALSKL